MLRAWSMMVGRLMLVALMVGGAAVPVAAGQAKVAPSVVVDAGEDKEIDLPVESVELNGFVLGYAIYPGMRVHWEQVSGPAAATIEAADREQTTMKIPQPGVYTLRLSTNNEGALLASDDVVFTVAGQMAPVAMDQPLAPAIPAQPQPVAATASVTTEASITVGEPALIPSFELPVPVEEMPVVEPPAAAVPMTSSPAAPAAVDLGAPALMDGFALDDPKPAPVMPPAAPVASASESLPMPPVIAPVAPVAPMASSDLAAPAAPAASSEPVAPAASPLIELLPEQIKEESMVDAVDTRLVVSVMDPAGGLVSWASVLGEAGGGKMAMPTERGIAVFSLKDGTLPQEWLGQPVQFTATRDTYGAIQAPVEAAVVRQSETKVGLRFPQH